MPDKIEKQKEQYLMRNSDYQIQRETLDGKGFIVVPAVMMVEGVHHGSAGPVLHVADELSKFPSAWNGRPVVIYHPEEDGQGISANSNPGMEAIHVGKIYNAMFDDKLRAELWLDEAKLQETSPAAYQYILEGKPIEVSVGVFSDEERVEGVWGGESYIAISHNYRPDHLALLPDSKGACGWEDGCGIRVNQKKGDENEVNEDLLMKAKELALAGVRVYLSTNEDSSYSEIMRALQEKLNAMDSPEWVFYLVEAYDDYIVYDVYPRSAEGASTLYKRGYKINADGKAEFTDDPVPVKRSVSYDPVSTMAQGTTKGGKTEMSDKKKCCPEKVDLLVQYGLFKEEEREVAEALDEAVIDTMLSMQAKSEKMEKTITDMQAQMNKAPDKVKPEDAVKVLKDHFSDPDKFIGMLPAPMQEQMRHGMQLYNDQKQSIVDGIVAADAEAYTREELEAKSMDELKKLSRLAKAPVDYSGFGTHGSRPASHEEPAMI